MPLRFPRPVMALIATGTAAICFGVSALPASADQVRNQEWWLNSLHVNAVWAASQGSGVTVAVLSDGVDASAADLSGSVTKGAVPTVFLAASGPYAGEQGTPIASLIAGHGHGSAAGAGIIGVAPEARILSISVTLPPDDPELAQSSAAASIPAAIAEGIRYAVNHGATVIDLPIDPGQAGSTGTAGASAAAGGSAAESAAVSYALAQDVVLVAPAGDDESAGDAPNYPAAYHGVIAVGAFDSAFSKAAWSSRQSYVTLTGPGADVIAADNAGGYQAINTTSAASAVVSGVAALIRSRYPGLTAAEVRQALITSTTHRQAGGLAIGSGYGAVDAGQAMAAAAALATPPGQRAAAGAMPRAIPAAAPAPSSARGIGAQVLRAAEISGALLIVLLLLTLAYVVTGRRRRRPRPGVAAEWTHRQAQSRYPQAGSDADRMLELFASPAPAPTVVPSAPADPAAPVGRHAPPPTGDGGWTGGRDGVFAPAVGSVPGWSVSGEPTAESAVAGASDSGWLSHGSASQAVNRRPSVSGAPPWEPAAAPDGELPWAAAPGRHAGAPSVDRSARRAALARVERASGAPGHVAPADAPAFAAAGEPSPTGSGAAADIDASPAYSPPMGGGSASVGNASNPGYSSSGDWSTPVEYRYRAGSPGPTETGTEVDASLAPRVAPSGLPVRQPRASHSPALAPLSPSGSLWEPARRDASSASEPTDYRDQSYDASGRPIFVWDPGRSREPRGAGSGD